MQTGPDLEADGSKRLPEGTGGLNRPCRPVEGGEESVACRVQLAAVESRELAANDRVVPLEELAPGRVAKASCQLRRADDIGEQDRREDALRLGASPESRDEAGRGFHRRAVGVVVDPRIDAAELRQLNDLGSPDPRCRVVPRAGQCWSRKDERRHPNGREHVADIELHDGSIRRQRGTGAQAAAQVPDKPVDESVVVRDLWGPFASELFEVAPRAPPGTDVPELLSPLLLGLGPGVLGCADAQHSRVEEDETGAALRIGRRKEHGDAGGVSAGPEHGPLRPDCIHDGPDVVHRGLERLHL
ncbi:MAG TPA: hypothetical protein VGQ85_05155, partial [Candidatus Limnocylindrales bacterium]|nr:hypothetical protein [Candidatus Limnocylindrales bacterium]